MIGIPLGLLYANATEWVAHKYVLHGLGKRKSSFWAFHWHEHHRKSRRNAFRDPDYELPLIGMHSQAKEAALLAALLATHLPLAPVAPFFTGTLVWSALDYYRKHKRSHLDPEWAREHLTWHYDHHMGPDQNKNWCVSRPWFDHIMGTREPYAGTEREAADRKKKASGKGLRRNNRARWARRRPASAPSKSEVVS